LEARLEADKAFRQRLDDYLDANLEEDFGVQIDRISYFEAFDNNTSLTLHFYGGQSTPSHESWYMVGVLFVVYPELDDVNVTSLAPNDVAYDGSNKFPTRVKYTFSKRYFTDEEIAAATAPSECEEDIDCGETTECLLNQCHNGRCSEIKVAGSDCR